VTARLKNAARPQHPGRHGRHPGPHRRTGEQEAGHPWWQVVCLTGVDYTGVLVMPQVAGGTGDAEERLARWIAGTRRLLRTAAAIMAVLLLTSSFATAVLIPAQEFQPGGAANGRALAYLAHLYLGNGSGTAYDASTIAILVTAPARPMTRARSPSW
jgi:hypothetical protein